MHTCRLNQMPCKPFWHDLIETNSASPIHVCICIHLEHFIPNNAFIIHTFLSLESVDFSSGSFVIPIWNCDKWFKHTFICQNICLASFIVQNAKTKCMFMSSAYETSVFKISATKKQSPRSLERTSNTHVMGVHAIDVSLINAAHLCNKGLWPTAQRDIKQIKPGCQNLVNVFKQMVSQFDFFFF